MSVWIDEYADRCREAIESAETYIQVGIFEAQSRERMTLTELALLRDLILQYRQTPHPFVEQRIRDVCRGILAAGQYPGLHASSTFARDWWGEVTSTVGDLEFQFG